MLFFAADLDEQAGDDPALVALLTEAAEKNPELRKLETYWTRRGAALQRMGDLAEACRAYEQALRIAPSSVPSYSAALACAVERDDRDAIAKRVAQWREDVHGSPETYPTYALALLKLHRDREAVAYMIRHLKERPNDYLWLLELADAVERLGDYGHAYRIRRHALLKLWPHAIAALKSGRIDAAGRQAILARAILARKLEGPEASYRWLEPLMPKGDGKIADAQVAELAVSYYLADGNSEMAKRVLLRSRVARRDADVDSDRNARLTLALLDNNLADAERLLTPPVDGQPFDGARLEALLKTGHDVEAAQAIDAALTSGSAEIERDTIRDLRSERADVSERIEPTVRAGYRLDAYGSLLVEGPHGEGIVSWNRVRLEADAQVNQISSSAAALPLGSYAEYQANVVARYRTLRTNTGLSLGADARAGVTVPQLVASHAHRVTDAFSLRLEAAFQSAPADTPILRAAGVRDAATLETGLSVTARDRVNVVATAFQERTMRQDALGVGGQGELTLSHTLVHAPEWAVQAAGFFLDRSLASGAAAALAKVGVPATSPAGDLLPTLAYMATIGTRLENGDPTSPWGRSSFPRYSLALDAGRLWPQDLWMLSVRGSVGMRVFGDDILGAMAYYSRGLAGEGTDAFRGASVYYAHGL
jgi:tetratricopeptide (TPR) repeat protein